jgi:hypothetical protein
MKIKIVLLSLVCATPLVARLGDTVSQLEERYGKSTIQVPMSEIGEEQFGKSYVISEKPEVGATVGFLNGKSAYEYVRGYGINIDQILTVNAGGVGWKTLKVSTYSPDQLERTFGYRAVKSMWIRNDGEAIAALHDFENPQLGPPTIMIIATDWIKRVNEVAEKAEKKRQTEADARLKALNEKF